jgi:hypothetical protein
LDCIYFLLLWLGSAKSFRELNNAKTGIRNFAIFKYTDFIRHG